MHKLTLGQYKGLNLKKPLVYGEADIEKAVVDSVLKSADEWASINRPIATGDIITMDIHATFNGEPVPELDNPNLTYKVGDTRGIKEFRAVIAHFQGDTVEFDVKFPENVPATQLRGKVYHFSALIKTVKHARTIALTNDVIHQMDPESKNLDDLKARFRQIIDQKVKYAERDQYKEIALDAIAKNATYELDQEEVTKVNKQLQEESNQFIKNMDLSQFPGAKDFKFEDEQYLRESRAIAEKGIVYGLVADQIIKTENITISDEELEAAKADMTSTPEYQEEFDKRFPDKEGFRFFLLNEKFIDKIIEWNMVD